MSRNLAGIVGCGKAKRELNVKTRIARLYTSDYFHKKRRYAELFCEEWYVLSAEYGLVDSKGYVDYYDTRLRDLSDDELEEWADGVARKLHPFPNRDWYDEVVVLAGREYVDPIRPSIEDLRERGMPVHEPFAGTAGNGEQKAWLKRAIEARDPMLDGQAPFQSAGLVGFADTKPSDQSALGAFAKGEGGGSR